MKKLLFMLLVLPLFWACGGDDDSTSDPLANTAWEYKNVEKTTVLGFERVETETFIIMLNANNKMNVDYYYKNNISAKQSKEKHAKGTYSYEHPNLTIKIEDGKTEKLTVNDSRTKLTDKEGNVYKKWSR